jgi:DNA-binding transcriptional ArsR family regulator
MTYQPVRDPRVLRALAHAVRARILDELTAAGSMRAADIAALLGIPANQASFHLRQLARYGLIEEDPDAGRDRRDRVWRPVSAQGLSINVAELEQVPGGAAAVAAWRRGSLARAQSLVASAYGPAEKGTHRAVSDSAMKLTEDEARQLSEELGAVLRRWSEKTRGRTDPDARTYSHFSVLTPYPEDPGA